MKAYKLLDESIIWEDGSRTYPPKMAKPADPPGTWPWSPPAGATVVDIATETPAQHPGIAVGEPYPGPVVSPGPPGPGPVVSPGPAPVIQPRHEINPLPATASAVDVWDRWQKLVTGWGCVIAWGGGDLDKLTVAVGGNMPLYKLSRGTKSAVGWWRDVQTAGLDKASSAADLGKGLGVDANDVRALVDQFNDLAKLARDKGYKGCPPAAPPPGAPSPAEDALATLSGARAGIGRAWAGLSPRGKLAAGAVGLGAAILIVRGVAK